MEKRNFCVDGDTIEVEFRYDAQWKVWLGEYPFFDEEPRYTPSGRPWKNVMHTGCPHAAGNYDDCGTCPHLKKQGANDLVGVCFHDALRQR